MLSSIERLRKRRASLIVPIATLVLAIVCVAAGELGLGQAADPVSAGMDSSSTSASTAESESPASTDNNSPARIAGEDFWYTAIDIMNRSYSDALERVFSGLEDASVVSEKNGTSVVYERAKAYESAFANKAIGVQSNDARLKITTEIAPASTRYTVMVYMVGSNLESQNAAATDDLQEMISAGLDFSQANLVVYAGGAKRWNTDIPAGHNNVLDLSRPKDDRVVAQTVSEVSMGAPETLAAFINFCEEHYPADRTALVFWDHGGGPLWGFGNDELAAGDSLLLPELREAMEATPYKAGSKRKLDLVGFDACLMSSMENASLWSNYARYLIASEEVEPGNGWDYSFLSELNKTTDTRAIGASALGSYKSYYEKHANTISSPDLTLSLIDLSQVHQAVEALDELFSALETDVANGEYAQVNRTRRKAKAFGLSAAGSRAEGYDLVDVGDFSKGMADQHPQQAAAVESAITKLAIERYANVDGACGISIYLPGDNRELYDSYETIAPFSGGGEANGQGASNVDSASAAEGKGEGNGEGESKGEERIALSRAYDDFVEAYAREWFATSEVDWTLAAVESTKEGLSLKLTDEQMEAFSSADYTVISQAEENASTLILTADVAIEPDEHRVLRVPADPELIAMQTDDGTSLPSFFVQIADDGNTKRYVDNYMFLIAAGNLDTVWPSRDPRVTAAVSVDAEGKVTTESFTRYEENIGSGGKNDIDPTEYSQLAQIYYRSGRAEPTFDENGNVLPWREWHKGGNGIFSSIIVDDSLRFGTVRASEINDMGHFSAQIVVTDVNGVQHAVEPIALQVPEQKKTSHETEINTRLGKLTFEVFEDHAVLTSYEGSDWTLDIPTTVENVPVTSIGIQAFQCADYLDELAVPEGITSIGAYAFSFAKPHKLTLPSTLESIGVGAFVGMRSMKEFVVEKGCKAAIARDGVLFSANGDTLIAYPAAKGTCYAIPQGTKVIGHEAFARSEIEHVVFPEGLLEIEPAAFFDCAHLESIEFPESLKSIGSLAYGQAFMRVGKPALPHIDRVRIGSNVREIGAYAFFGIALGAIEVDERNEMYSSKGGVLLNAAGDTLVEAPRGIAGVVEVPEGIVALSDYAFADYATNSEFLLPTSLARCAETSFPSNYETDENTGANVRVGACVIHAAKDSYASRFAAEHEFDHDFIVDKKLLDYELATAKQGDYTLMFRVYIDRAVLTAVDDGSSESGEVKGHKVEIPAKVRGKPVTEVDLGRDIIRRGKADYLSDDDASSVEEIELPASVQRVWPGTLSFFKKLERIEVESGSEHFSSVDGVLFSADETVLIAFPANKTPVTDNRKNGRDDANSTDGSDAATGQSRKWQSVAYEIPEGTERVGERAFRNSSGLLAVVFPESLKAVEAEAFFGCFKLDHVEFSSGLETIGAGAFKTCEMLIIDTPLPEGLEVVGECAFSRCAGYEGLALPDSLEAIGASAFDAELGSEKDELRPVDRDVLAIGPHLKRIAFLSSGGMNDGVAFTGLDIKGFDVDPENESFRATGPFLLDAKGTRLVAFASGHAGEARVPDGVREINAGLLASAPRLTDLYIPPTVAHIEGKEFVTGGLAGALSSVHVHVKAGSYAERYARERGLSWDVE